MDMEQRITQQYWSFGFWLKKAIWLGLFALSVWMVWQFVFRSLPGVEDFEVFTSTGWRWIGGLLFAAASWFFGVRLFNNWDKDAVVRQIFSPVGDTPPLPRPQNPFAAAPADVAQMDASVTAPRVEVPRPDEVYVEASDDVSSPPPFGVRDDLTLVEGVGPAIAEVLNDVGVFTFTDLARLTVAEIEEILDNAGEQFRFHNPETWPDQAQHIVDEQWRSINQNRSQ